MKKRAQSGIITTILLILIAIVSFIILYNVFFHLIKNKTSDIGIESFLVDGEIEYYLPDEFAIINVKRQSGSGNITGLKVLFNEEAGSTYSYETEDYPEPLETKKYVILKDDLEPVPDVSWNFGSIGSIALHYIFAAGKLSNELDKKDITPERISPKLNKNWYCDNDRDGFGADTTVYDSKSEAESACGADKVTPISGDCNDNDAGTKACSGETPYCHENECKNNKDYDVSSSALDDSFEDCTENEQSNTDVSFSFVNDAGWTNGANFYNGYMDDVKICMNGYISTDGSACVNNLDPSTFDITDKEVISPYYYKKPLGTAKVNYCIKTDYIIFKWTDTSGNMAETLIYKNGNIKYDYKKGAGNFLNTKIGISDGQGYYTQIFTGSNIQNEYQLTF